MCGTETVGLVISFLIVLSCKRKTKKFNKRFARTDTSKVGATKH
jgi:hypothetical protein